jgi:hypothetical protein
LIGLKLQPELSVRIKTSRNKDPGREKTALCINQQFNSLADGKLLGGRKKPAIV